MADNTPLAVARRNRLLAAMAAAGIDEMVVYGNGWQGDYLRYVSDFGILEGQALALRTTARTGTPTHVVWTEQVHLAPKAGGRLIVGSTVEESIAYAAHMWS